MEERIVPLNVRTSIGETRNKLHTSWMGRSVSNIHTSRNTRAGINNTISPNGVAVGMRLRREKLQLD